MWALFFADVKRALDKVDYEACLFADDLTAFEEFAAAVDEAIILASCDRAQRETQSWGTTNSVFFDAGKEQKLKIGRFSTYAEFKLLGVIFDSSLKMEVQLEKTAARGHARLTAILRTSAHCSRADLVALYKAQV